MSDNFVKLAKKDMTVSCNTTGIGVVRVALHIVHVRVRASNSLRYVETYALLDSGSTNTLCSERLADELLLDGETHELTLTTLDKEDTRVSSCVVSLEWVAKGGFHSLDRVLIRPSIPIKRSNIGQKCELTQWRHLRDSDILEVDATSVMVLMLDAAEKEHCLVRVKSMLLARIKEAETRWKEYRLMRRKGQKL